VADGEHPVGRLGRLDHAPALLGGAGHRLLAHHVLAGLQRADREIGVLERGDAEVHEVDRVVGEQCGQTIVGPQRREVLACGGAGVDVAGRLGPVAREFAAGDVADGDDLRLGNLLVPAEVRGAHHAQTDDGNVDCHGSPPVCNETC